MREDAGAEPARQEETQQPGSLTQPSPPEASTSSSDYPPVASSSSSGSSRATLLPLPPPAPPASASSSAAPAGRSLLSSWGAPTTSGAGTVAGGSRLLTPPPPGRRSGLLTGSSAASRAKGSRTMEMLRSFSSTSTASDEEAALDAAPGSASATTSAAAPARSQVPRRSIAHNPSFLLEAGYSGASGSSPRGKGGPGQASSSAGPPPPSPGLGGAPADWDEVDLEFDVDLEMARGESGGGAGGKGTPGRGGRDRSSRGGEGEQVPMQKLGSGSGRLKMARGGSQIHRPTIMEEQGEVAVGAGSAPSSMSEYDATPKPSMDVHPPPIREEDEGSAQSLLGQHRRTTSTSSSQGKLSKARLLDNDGNEAVHRHQENSIQPRPPSYTPRAPGHDDSALEENEDEDEDGETPTARHIDRSYLDPGEGMGSARRLDFEPLTRREKWAYAVTALVVAVLAGLAVAIGGDLVDWPGDGIGNI